MNKILKEHFSNLYKSERIGHAFLICNTVFDNLKEDLKEILSDYFFGCEINMDESLDIYVIKPENNKISKETIINLQDVFKTKSQINPIRVYIIDGIEKMNDYAANSLLKFLEEPEEGIYAFLITSNIDKVLPTIKSRCQIMRINYNQVFNLSLYDEETVQKAIKFVVTYEKYGLESIAYIYEFLAKKEEKETIINMLEIIKNFYYSCLMFLIKNEVSSFSSFNDKIRDVVSKNNESSLVNKLLVLNKYESMLEYNLNLNLFLDKMIIDLEAKKDE